MDGFPHNTKKRLHNSTTFQNLPKKKPLQICPVSPNWASPQPTTAPQQRFIRSAWLVKAMGFGEEKLAPFFAPCTSLSHTIQGPKHAYVYYHTISYPYATHGAGICTPTFARTKSPSFVGKYSSTMEHMGYIM